MVGCGRNTDGQCDIPPLEKGTFYVQVAAGGFQTLLLRSDGTAVACGDNSSGEFEIPALDEGISYIQVSAGTYHSVLLRSDGHAVACGSNTEGQCNISPLDKGLRYTQVSAGQLHTVLLRSDGLVVACGLNDQGQCDIPSLEPGTSYVGDIPLCADLVLQLDLVGEDDALTLISSTLVGEEKIRLQANQSDEAWEIHKRLASELEVNLPNLQLVLPDGQLLANFCRAHPGATLADVKRTNRTI